MWPQLDSHEGLWTMSCASGLVLLGSQGTSLGSSISAYHWLQDAGHGGHVAWTLPGEAPILPRAIL